VGGCGSRWQPSGRPAAHLDLRVVVDAVRVGQEVLLAGGAGRHERAAVGGVLALALPRQRVVGLCVDAVDLDDRVEVLRLQYAAGRRRRLDPRRPTCAGACAGAAGLLGCSRQTGTPCLASPAQPAASGGGAAAGARARPLRSPAPGGAARRVRPPARPPAHPPGTTPPRSRRTGRCRRRSLRPAPARTGAAARATLERACQGSAPACPCQPAPAAPPGPATALGRPARCRTSGSPPRARQGPRRALLVRVACEAARPRSSAPAALSARRRAPRQRGWCPCLGRRGSCWARRGGRGAGCLRGAVRWSSLAMRRCLRPAAPLTHHTHKHAHAHTQSYKAVRPGATAVVARRLRSCSYRQRPLSIARGGGQWPGAAALRLGMLLRGLRPQLHRSRRCMALTAGSPQAGAGCAIPAGRASRIHSIAGTCVSRGAVRRAWHPRGNPAGLVAQPGACAGVQRAGTSRLPARRWPRCSERDPLLEEAGAAGSWGPAPQQQARACHRGARARSGLHSSFPGCIMIVWWVDSAGRSAGGPRFGRDVSVY
jgi:hypothetical protein